ncbi:MULTISPECIES: MBL fold metallo-hydrolase [Snodgrassella]|uniref:MBL fold metallo-hydrolase n=1 Tax=Snodgrassella TaxID=1193515 RepID=UPI0004D7E755|nr:MULTISPECIES: MBL fold metallo-hydrolase [Snodgrassella]KES10859.1 Zn-dependent hydrolase [Snodgrassella alvi SCGC AB-598-O11]MBI0068223.1 MBL fold metallo-hydrolase [Snodgrassella sp. M0110]MBI0077135.1 MBL fold metallo-hydrolase [Snodgrassella sp. M0118]MBI0079524.1 MBL fold metallo-hydrolase [Snodgrassella sp. M0112]NUF79582.1 MBL fold metallo-hydrolase [Snodgrassella sp. ESL0323]
MALQIQVIPVTPFQQNAALLWDDVSREAVLTDVGGEAERLLSAVSQHQLKLQAIWLTHGHLDHASGVADLTEQQSVPVLGPHQSDDYWLQALPEITANYGFPVSKPLTPTSWLEDGDELSVGEHKFIVYHIPGHTPGHVVFYNQENNLLIAGDVLFRESIGRTDFPGGNHADLIHGIQSKLLTLPDSTRVLPGHGPMTTIGHEKLHNPYLR